MKFGAVFMALLILGGVNAAIGPRVVRLTQPLPRVVANQRLTALNGVFLFVLLAALAITVLFINLLLPIHYLVGIALIPPLALKLYTTGYRFMKYYLRDKDFRIAGPPPLFQRFFVAPSLVISTVAVMATGVELWAFGARFGSWWVSAHTSTAVLFMLAVFLHLLGHARRSATALVEDPAVQPASNGITFRSVLLACGILSCILAAASLTYATPFGSGGGG